MKYNYQFSATIGASYQNGQICFTPDGKTLFSPIGNNISVLHINRDEIETIDVDSSYNIDFVALSPIDPIMLCINEEGFMHIISTITGNEINTHNFNQKVHSVSFSPNGKMFAVGRSNLVTVFYTPELDKPYRQLRQQRTYYGAKGNITSIDWSSSSKAFVIGCDDGNTMVYSAFKTSKLVVYTLSFDIGAVIKTSFMKDSLNVLSVGKSAKLCYWVCNKSLDFLSPDEIQEEFEASKTRKEKNVVTYLKPKFFRYNDVSAYKNIEVDVSAADFHRQANLLVTGFVDGRILVHDMPDFNPLYYLCVSSGEINTVSFNNTASWIAIGSRDHNELNIFCWKSQSYIFQSKGHMRSTINCLEYSPNGTQLVTGGHDNSVKLWQLSNGRCCATFNSHSGPVTGIAFPAKKCQIFFSSSLDGTVRGYDISKLKNFCALSAETRSHQFTCVSCDYIGQLVAAGGGSDCFSVLVWELKTRRLCYTLSGHEQPVCSVQFSSVAGGTHLVSGSWDKTIRVWQLSGGDSSELIHTASDVLAVAFRPDGVEIAASMLNGSIVVFDTVSGDQLKEIEGKHDLGLSKHEGELVSTKRASEEKIFQTLCYSANGLFLLAGGNSKYICLYSIELQLLIARFEISCNLSLEGILEVHDRRKINQWGFSDATIDMSKKRSMPGVSKDNNSKRILKLEAMVSCVKFCPTGTNFAASTSEGVMIFSNEKTFRKINSIGGASDFSQMQIDISPSSVEKLLEKKQFAMALDMALRLKKIDVLTQVVETTPINEVSFSLKQLDIYAVGLTLAKFLAIKAAQSECLGLYVHWIKVMLSEWTLQVKKIEDSNWQNVMKEIDNAMIINRSKLIGFQNVMNKSSLLLSWSDKSMFV